MDDGLGGAQSYVKTVEPGLFNMTELPAGRTWLIHSICETKQRKNVSSITMSTTRNPQPDDAAAPHVVLATRRELVIRLPRIAPDEGGSLMIAAEIFVNDGLGGRLFPEAALNVMTDREHTVLWLYPGREYQVCKCLSAVPSHCFDPTAVCAVLPPELIDTAALLDALLTSRHLFDAL